MKIQKSKVSIFSTSIFLSLFIIHTFSGLFIFRNHSELDNFKDRVVSHATSMGYDASQRINQAYLFLISASIICIVVYSLFTKLLNNTKSNQKIQIIKLLEELSTFGLIAIAYGYLVGAMDFAISYVGIFVLTITSLLIFTKNLKLYIVEWAMLLSMPIAIFLITVPFSNRQNPNTFLIIMVITFLILIGISHLAHKIGKNKLSEEKIETLLVKSSFPLFLTAIIQSFLIELFNILNRRGIIIVDNLKLVYLVVVFSAIIIGIILFISQKQKSTPVVAIKHIIQKYWYLIFILTLIMLIVQPLRAQVPWSEYFETANHGLGINNLFRYGQIPIMESFDAHMILYQIPGIIFSLLNGYEPWAYFLYASYELIIVYPLIYFLLSRIIGKRVALIFVITLPFTITIFPINFIYATLLLIYLFKMIDTKEIKSSLPFWLIIVGIIVLTLDMGFAAAIAGIVTYSAILVLKKENLLKRFIRFGLEGLGVALFTIATFSVLCFIKGISPISRIIEFLKISLSNQNWAHASIGDSTSTAFALSFYIIPIIALILLFITIRTVFINKQKNINQYAVIGFIFSITIYFANIQRSLVKHMVVESIVISFFPLALLFFVCIWIKRKQYKVYIVSVMALLGCILLTMRSQQIPAKASLINQIISSTLDTAEYAPAQDLSKSRVEGEPEHQQHIQIFKLILDTLLKEDETYLDLTSLNYYYALVERKKPVYVNQSPMILSGELSQTLYLQQIKESKVPLAILPIANVGDQPVLPVIDGISVSDKYYLIAEYVYQNYEPLCLLDGFIVWADKDQIDEFRTKLLTLKKEKSIYSYNFDDENSNQLLGVDAEVYHKDNKLFIVKNGTYPVIDNIINKEIKAVAQEQGNYILSLKVKPKESGNIQIFYKLGEDTAYSEAQTKIFTLDAQEEAIIQIMLEEPPTNIRLDMPEITELEISDISILQLPANFELISSNKTAESFPDHNLGLVPWYWANKDENANIVATQELLLEPSPDGTYTQATFHQNKQDTGAQYITLSINSPVEQGATLLLKDYEDNVKDSTFTFKLKAGVHQYRLRASADYGYYAGIYDGLTINADTTPIVVDNIIIEQEPSTNAQDKK